MKTQNSRLFLRKKKRNSLSFPEMNGKPGRILVRETTKRPIEQL